MWCSNASNNAKASRGKAKQRERHFQAESCRNEDIAIYISMSPAKVEDHALVQQLTPQCHESEKEDELSAAKLPFWFSGSYASQTLGNDI
jgi:hypothetical protein